MKYYLIILISMFMFSLAGCENIENSRNVLEALKKIEPLLEIKCGSKAVVNAVVLDGKIVEAGVFFLNDKFEVNNDNIICSKSIIKNELVRFFQEEYGYHDVQLYMMYDKLKVAL